LVPGEVAEVEIDELSLDGDFHVARDSGRSGRLIKYSSAQKKLPPEFVVAVYDVSIL
jgi:hypothetical protein